MAMYNEPPTHTNVETRVFMDTFDNVVHKRLTRNVCRGSIPSLTFDHVDHYIFSSFELCESMVDIYTAFSDPELSFKSKMLLGSGEPSIQRNKM
jgi:hypothetical protein